MAGSAKSDYEGILSQPIEYDALSTLRDTGAIASRIDALCLSFGVDPRNVNRPLVLRLARRYVPGFQIGKVKRPRQRKWDDIGLASLWLLRRDVQRGSNVDKETVAKVLRHESVWQITGKIKPVWIQQLLNKARLSPLVQLIESSNPADNQFAREFIAKHARQVDV